LVLLPENPDFYVYKKIHYSAYHLITYASRVWPNGEPAAFSVAFALFKSALYFVWQKETIKQVAVLKPKPSGGNRAPAAAGAFVLAFCMKFPFYVCHLTDPLHEVHSHSYPFSFLFLCFLSSAIARTVPGLQSRDTFYAALSDR